MLQQWLCLVLISLSLQLATSRRKVFDYKILKDFPAECTEATRIDDGTRRFDMPENSPTSGEMDNELEPGWYWFLGSSGNVLMEGHPKNVKPGDTAPRFCSTTYSGTLMGSHPTEEEGIVEMNVCFRARDCYKEGIKTCTCHSINTIFVRNCRTHYIYFLMPTKRDERYCTNMISMPKKNDPPPSPKNVSEITECLQYKEMPNGPNSKRVWDQMEDVSCDNDLQGWYRFNQPEGYEMASQCLENQEITDKSRFGQPCGANFRGWMVDRHPTVEEGRVQRKICFSYDKRCYCEFYTNIAVRNCGTFYVYRLGSVPTCNAKFCGAPAGKRAKDLDYTKNKIAAGPYDMCKNYEVQYDPDRLWTYTSPTVMKCDSELYGKYRFGSKYTPWQMKEGCNTTESNSQIHRCGSKYHGYMLGEHPVPEEGYVERVICFESADNPCECKHSATVGVQNCGGFFVYYFKGVPSCSSRYCMLANNSMQIRLNPGLPPMYEIPSPNEKPTAAPVLDDDDDGNGGLIAATAALSIIILIIIILLIIIIVILVIKVLPGYRRRSRHGDETPSYASSAHDYPMQSKSKQPKQSPPPSNGGLPKEDPEQIPPYPSVLPPGREDADEMDSPASSQARPGASNSDLKDIPDDLQLTDDDDEDENADDCDTLMKKEDFNRPQSYDQLPSKDSAV